MIRRATAADLPRIVEIGRRHHEAAGNAGDYDPDAAASFAASLISGGVVFLSDDGMLGGMIAPSYSAPSHRMAVEMFWSAEDGQGLALLRAFEAWAEEQDADEVRLSAVVGHRGEAVGRLLRRKGYAPVETSYGKAV